MGLVMRIVIFALITLIGFADQIGTPKVGPDGGKILRVTGRGGMGHACPIAPDVVLTAAHNIDPEPYDATVGLVALRFAAINRSSKGMLIPVVVSQAEDLGIMTTEEKLQFYPIAPKQPEPGDQLWWAAYKLDRQKDAGIPVLHTGRVNAVYAGLIIMDESAIDGSSGSCMLNEKGEVVGIMIARVTLGPPVTSGLVQPAAALGLSVVPPWLLGMDRLREKYKIGQGGGGGDARP